MIIDQIRLTLNLPESCRHEANGKMHILCQSGEYSAKPITLAWIVASQRSPTNEHFLAVIRPAVETWMLGFRERGSKQGKISEHAHKKSSTSTQEQRASTHANHRVQSGPEAARSDRYSCQVGQKKKLRE